MTKKLVVVDPVTLGEVIDMALSDHVSFTAINELFGLDENEVKTIMRAHLRPARYRAWRSRVQTFGDRRASYKRDDPHTTDPHTADSHTIENRTRRVHTPPAALSEGESELDEELDHEETYPPPPERKSAPKKRALAKP
jgi:uncharacterized protein (TIGR03643 family)